MGQVPYEFNYTNFTSMKTVRPAIDRLENEVRYSGIHVALRNIEDNPALNRVTIYFRNTLTALDIGQLNRLVENHRGEPLVPRVETRSQGPVVESDGKMVVTTDPATDGFRTWVTGRGDQIPAPPGESGRGTGPKMTLPFDGPGTKHLEVNFNEPIEIFGGYFRWSGTWDMDDELDIYVKMPATEVEASPGNNGNANPVEVGGGLVIYVPADNNGSLSLVKAVPVFSSKKDGFWNLDHNTGQLVPSSAPGEGEYHLLNVAKVGYMARAMHPPKCDDFREQELKAFRVEYCHPTWKLCATIRKQSEGAGKFYANAKLFRRNITP